MLGNRTFISDFELSRCVHPEGLISEVIQASHGKIIETVLEVSRDLIRMQSFVKLYTRPCIGCAWYALSPRLEKGLYRIFRGHWRKWWWGKKLQRYFHVSSCLETVQFPVGLLENVLAQIYYFRARGHEPSTLIVGQKTYRELVQHLAEIRPLASTAEFLPTKLDSIHQLKVVVNPVMKRGLVVG